MTVSGDSSFFFFFHEKYWVLNASKAVLLSSMVGVRIENVYSFRLVDLYNGT